MTPFEWIPSDELLSGSNVARFMRAHGIGSAEELRQRSIAEPEWFWPAIVEDLGIEFSTPWSDLRDASGGVPFTEWFCGGELNITHNCLDRHASGPRAGDECLVGITETGATARYTFASLSDEVSRCAAALERAGVVHGDRVAAYMPMTVEVVVQMLSCLKIGAIFIPVFSGYAPAALAERLRDAEPRLLFTASSTSRRGKRLDVKANADSALDEFDVERVVVVTDDRETSLREGRDVTWTEFLSSGSGGTATVACASMDPAIILYTSGTTGRPKGTVHSHAGALVQIAKEVSYSFDLTPSDRFYWLTDIGWMMGPWTILGGLFCGATVIISDGAFDYPEPDQLWRLLAGERVSVFGISPTAIRMLMRRPLEEVERHDLSSLRILGSTGEPWDDESWHWTFERVGGKRCPIINISGGTDIIGCFLAPLPIDPLKPCSLVGPGLGMPVEVWNEDGESVTQELGYLVATEHTPSMTRGLWRDRERYLESYWSRWDDVWNHGDWARIDEDGQWFLQGRSDDTLKVAGRRIGPAELEGALMETGHVAEAAAVGVPHEIKGTGIVCFVVLKPDATQSDELRAELEQAIVERLGKVDRPEEVVFVGDLPKTRSAKILRRMVRARYLDEPLGDLASVQNPEAIEAIPQQAKRSR